MFWGLIIEPGKKYSQTVENTFHISKAALDLTSAAEEDTSLIIDYEGQQEFILCHLNKKDNKQESLDLNFQAGDSISLFSHGPGSVHLSGYLLGEDDDEDDDMTLGDMLEEEEEDEEEGEDEEVEVKTKGNKRALPSSNGMAQKKKKMDVLQEESDDEEDEDDDEEEEEEEKPKPPTKPVQHAKPKEEKKGPKPQQQQQQQQAGKGGKPNKEGAATGAMTQNKKTLPGGLIVEDVKEGAGTVAVSGKKVGVYYTGRLQVGNKQFDQCIKGQPFKFRLGGGEVIKGWDMGVAGMKLGGKRRLTIPANLGYGKKGAPPDIPPNSTLVFDVELKHVQ